MRRDFPQLKVLPVEADFTKPFRLPARSPSMPRDRILSGLDHRQFRAARGVGVPAPRAPDARSRRDADHRRRSGQGRRGAQRGLQRLRRRHGEIQSQSAHPHQSRARRQFRSRRILPPGVLQFRTSPHRDASCQQEAPEGARRRPHDRLPRRRNHPHREQLQIHARIVRRAGARLGLDAGRRCGPTRTSIFPCRRSSRRTSEASSTCRVECLAAGPPAR